MEDWIQQETPQLLQRRNDQNRRDNRTYDQYGKAAGKRQSTSMSALHKYRPDTVVTTSEKETTDTEMTEPLYTAHSRIQR